VPHKIKNSHRLLRSFSLFLPEILGLVVVLQAAAGSLPVVKKVELERYMGKWHEIARLPMFFQRNCLSEITAQYSLRTDGKVDVVNQCKEKGGSLSTARGTAKVVEQETNAKLKVTFFWPFSGDYWILDLGPNYEYAMVGEPRRKYLWILGRTPEMEESLYQELVLKAKNLGFDTSQLIRSNSAK
jgi:apolipoprotein D and lipocalin family protein